MSLAAALLASAPSAAAAPVALLPPMVITVSSVNDVSRSLVSRTLAEADAIWKNTGFAFVWQRQTEINAEPKPSFENTSSSGLAGAEHTVRRCSPRAACPEPVEGRASRSQVPSSLHVVIGDEVGPQRDSTLPLGWIVFDDLTPEPHVYVSYTNVLRLFEGSSGVVGVVSQMTVAERETYLARGMGRALAHELGHYLLASKVHTPQGLMRATWGAAESFYPDRSRFVIDPAQRQLLVARLRDEPRVGDRQTPAYGRGGGG